MTADRCRAWLATVARQCRGLRLREPEGWPDVVRRLAAALAAVAVFAAGWASVCASRMGELERERQRHAGLRTAFQARAGLEADVATLQRRCAALAARMASVEAQLIETAGVDALLTDIGRVGMANGLRLELFRPHPSEIGPHFAGIPVALRAIGRFRDLAAFHAAIGALPGLVIMRDMQLSGRKGEEALTMEVVAMAYRALDAAEQVSGGPPPRLGKVARLAAGRAPASAGDIAQRVPERDR